MDYEMTEVTPEEMLEAERKAVNDGLVDTFAVMAYELGAIAQNLVFAKNAPSDGLEGNANHANVLIELGDLLAQAALLHVKLLEASPNLVLRPTWEQLVAMGRHRQLERMDALAAKMRRAASLSDE